MASFSTDEYGFASFYLSPMTGDEKYYALVEDTRMTSQKVNLPPVENDGVSIWLKINKCQIESQVQVCGSVQEDGLLYLLSGADGIYFEKPLSSVKKINLPYEGMPSGVNNALVCDKDGNILAKRPFFVMPKNTLSPEMQASTKDFGIRDNVSVSIDLGTLSDGSFSVSVTDDSLAPASNLGDNIISYMLLSSEIRGCVENPRRFFNDSIPMEKRAEELDLMLMSQGWEYYDLPAVMSGNYSMPKYGREYVQSIAGQVKRGLLRKKKSPVVAFVAPSINFAAVGQLDKDGLFELKDVDFPDSTTFIVSAANSFNGRPLKPIVFEDSFAPFKKFVHSEAKIKYTPEVAEILTSNYYDTGGELAYELNSITVYGTKKSLKGISPFPNWDFRSDQIRQGKKLESYKSYDMISYIVATCPGVREKNQGGIRSVVCRVVATASRFQVQDPWEPIVVFIDGMRMISWRDLESLMVDDVETVVYLRGLEAAPFLAAGGNFDANSNRSVVLVKTKPIYQIKWHVTRGTPLGYQKPRHFYSPRYEVDGKDIVRKGGDSRSTLYWNPNLKPEGGKINLRFNSSDLLNGYTVTIEGITSEGELISKRIGIK